jgi:hypothetical protein
MEVEEPGPPDRLQQEGGEKEKRDGDKQDGSPVRERHRRMAQVLESEADGREPGDDRTNHECQVSCL